MVRPFFPAKMNLVEALQAEGEVFPPPMAQYGALRRPEDPKRSVEHALYQAEGAALKDWQQSQTDLATAAAAMASAHNRLRLLGKTDSEIAAFERAQSRSGSDAIFSVGSGTRVWLVADVRQEDAPKVRLGDDIEVRVPAYPNRIFQSKLGYMASLIDPNTHRLVVGALVPNPDGTLRANMSATMRPSRAVRPAPPPPFPPNPSSMKRAPAVWVAGNDSSLALPRRGPGADQWRAAGSDQGSLRRRKNCHKWRAIHRPGRKRRVKARARGAP